jgi:hypothetical protein
MSVICGAICQWPKLRRTHIHTLLSHLRLLGSLPVASYDSQGLRRKYSNQPPHGNNPMSLELSFVKIGYGIQKLITGDTQTAW